MGEDGHYKGDGFISKYSYTAIASLLVILFSWWFPATVYANAAEPPCFTVIVSNPPEDLSLFLHLPALGPDANVELIKEKKAWETYYRFFYHTVPSSRDSLENALLLVASSDQTFRLTVPIATFRMYNNVLTLDLKQQDLILGQLAHRVPLLVALRVILTLLIEGVIFYLFGYREKRSWLVFLTINILTQGSLNALITGPRVAPYWFLGYVLGELVILAAEMAAFVILLKEHSRRRAVLYTFCANATSLIVGGIAISNLPI